MNSDGCSICLRRTRGKARVDRPGETGSRPHPFGRYTLIMDTLKMLAELRAERDQISEAMVALERLATGLRKRRGRPPAWMTELKVKRRGRPPGSKNKPQE